MPTISLPGVCVPFSTPACGTKRLAVRMAAGRGLEGGWQAAAGSQAVVTKPGDEGETAGRRTRSKAVGKCPAPPDWGAWVFSGPRSSRRTGSGTLRVKAAGPGPEPEPEMEPEPERRVGRAPGSRAPHQFSGRRLRQRGKNIERLEPRYAPPGKYSTPAPGDGTRHKLLAFVRWYSNSLVLA